MASMAFAVANRHSRNRWIGGFWLLLLAAVLQLHLVAQPPAGPETGVEDLYWDDQFGIPGTNGPVLAVAVDAAGKLYVGGSFTIAGRHTVNRIAMWDGSAWCPLGSGMDGDVRAIAVSGGNVYVAGDFTMAGGVEANRAAVWDGTSWSALGSGMDGRVNALAVHDGALYAGGAFTLAGGAAAGNIARWNGSAWSAVGGGTDGPVLALAAGSAGLYVAGGFTAAGGGGANRAALWNGSAWSALGPGLNGTVHALLVEGADVYVGGAFTMAGGTAASRAAKWNGSAWSAMAGGMDDEVWTLEAHGGKIYAGGKFIGAGGAFTGGMAEWNGTAWAAFNSSFMSETVLLLSDGARLYRCPSTGISAWDGTSWSSLAQDMSTGVTAMVVMGNDVYVANGKAPGGIFKWDGVSWTPVASGMVGGVQALAALDGCLYAGGMFSSINGVAASNIAKWNGSTWSALGSGTSGRVRDLAVNGSSLYVGGDFLSAGGVSGAYAARWNGSAWSAVGPSVGIPAAAVAADGAAVYVGGFRMSNPAPVAMTSGSAWTYLSNGASMDTGVQALVTSGSQLIAATDSRVAVWDGSVWSTLGAISGSGQTSALAVCGSDLYVGGSFTSIGGIAANGIAKWNGATWSAVGSGVNGACLSLEINRNALILAGTFLMAGGKASSIMAHYQPRVNASSATVTASPGETIVGNDGFGFYKPALAFAAGTTVATPGGLPATVTLDRAAEIRWNGARVNGACVLSPVGMQFGGVGAQLTVEFSEDDAAACGQPWSSFRAVQLAYPANYPASMEAVSAVPLGAAAPAPVRVENGRQIYAITVPVAVVQGVYGAVPNPGPTAADSAWLGQE